MESSLIERAETVILDIDGTLVDTNYHHAIAWHRALKAHGHRVQLWEIHRHIGMGGDQIVEALVGAAAERDHGDEIREEEGEAYEELIGEVDAMEGASELLGELSSAGRRTVLASSAKPEEVDHYLDLLDARELVDAWTTAGDVEATKPAPELIEVALEKVGGEAGSALLIGDSIWDVKAAEAAGVPTLAVLTGGFSESELREAGAADVVREISQLLAPATAR
jgi:HAD superfamily hydrolase (TIGR01509 family)